MAESFEAPIKFDVKQIMDRMEPKKKPKKPKKPKPIPKPSGGAPKHLNTVTSEELKHKSPESWGIYGPIIIESRYDAYSPEEKFSAAILWGSGNKYGAMKIAGKSGVGRWTKKYSGKEFSSHGPAQSHYYNIVRGITKKPYYPSTPSREERYGAEMYGMREFTEHEMQRLDYDERPHDSDFEPAWLGYVESISEDLAEESGEDDEYFFDRLLDFGYSVERGADYKQKAEEFAKEFKKEFPVLNTPYVLEKLLKFGNYVEENAKHQTRKSYGVKINDYAPYAVLAGLGLLAYLLHRE